MPIDASIYSQQQTPDILGSVQRGMSIRDMADDRAIKQKALHEQEAIKGAYKAGVTTNPDGSMSVDEGKTLSALSGINPLEAQKFKAQQAQNRKLKMEQAIQEADLIGRHLRGVKDQPTLDIALAGLEKSGVDVSQYKGMPYDPKIIEQKLGQTLSFKDRLEQEHRAQDQANKDRDFNQRQQHEQTYRQDVAVKRDQVSGEKIDKLAKDFKKDMDPDSSRTGNFGQISAKYQSGERLKTLLGAFHDGNLPPAQVEEMALGMANMISGSNGGAARAQVEALVPHSAMGDAQKFKSWLMNEPYGANQQKFVEMMSHTIDREMDTAQDQLNGIRVKRLSTHERFKKSAPDQYNRMLSDYGINQNKKPGETAGATPFHTLSDDELDKAYKAAGGK